MADPPPKIQPPDLRRYQLIISPNLAHLGPECHQLLLGLPTRAMSLETACGMTSPEGIADADDSILAHPNDITLLTDHSNDPGTIEDMVALVQCAKSWSPRTVFVYDWRLLDVLITEHTSEKEKRERVNEIFVAQIRWVDGHEARGEVRVQWWDGIIMTVSEERVRELRMKVVGVRG